MRLKGWWLRPLMYLGGLLAAVAVAGIARAADLVIPGSGNPEHVLTLLAEDFNTQQIVNRVTVPPSSGTAGAIRDVLAGTAVLGRLGRKLKPDEAAQGLAYIPLGRDPVAFAGGSGVTINGLTHAQAVEAYSGQAANWMAFGGQPGPIRAIGRESTDASRQAINRVLPAFENMMFGEGVKIVHLDPQLIELLDRFPGALGFLNRSALASAKTKIVYLAFNGVEPTAENVEAGRYPLWLEFGLVHRTGVLPPEARGFVDYLRSASALRILKTQGVLAAAEAPQPR